MKTAIIGAGWLGLPLAQCLLKNGHSVVATKRSVSGVEKLQGMGISALQYNLGDNLAHSEMQLLFDAQLLIINIPPGRKSLNLEQFKNSMLSLLALAKQQGVQNVIFISTSAVYGESSRTVYEYSALDPQTASAKAHADIEKYIAGLFKHNACILRLAGLVSQDRHPARSLSARKNIANGHYSVNLVHRDDVIRAIQQIILHNKFGHTYHLSSSDHPSRQQYYTDASESLGLEPPEFVSTNSDEKGKVINCDFTLRELGLRLHYPSPYDML